MVLIKIINGIYGYRPEGRQIVVPTSPKDPPIGVNEAEAERLVEAGIARYVDESLNHHDHSHDMPVATLPPQPDADNSIVDMAENGGDENAVSEGEKGIADSAEDDVTGHLDAETLKTWKFDDLKALAVDMGIDVSKIRKKDALVETICEVEVSAPVEAIVPEVEDVVE